MERAFVRLKHHSTTADELLEVTARAIPVFEVAGEDRLLGKAWMFAGSVQGGHRGQNHVGLQAA